MSRHAQIQSKILYPNCISYLLIGKKKTEEGKKNISNQILNLIFRQRLSNLIVWPFFPFFLQLLMLKLPVFWNFLFSKCSNYLYIISKYFKGKRFTVIWCALLLIVVLPKIKVVSLVHIIYTFVVVLLKMFYFGRCWAPSHFHYCVWIETEHPTILQELAF